MVLKRTMAVVVLYPFFLKRSKRFFFEHPPSPYTLEGAPPLPIAPLTYCRPLSRLDRAKASFALCSLLHRLSQRRGKLKIAESVDFQGFGTTLKLSPLRGES